MVTYPRILARKISWRGAWQAGGKESDTTEHARTTTIHEVKDSFIKKEQVAIPLGPES